MVALQNWTSPCNSTSGSLVFFYDFYYQINTKYSKSKIFGWSSTQNIEISLYAISSTEGVLISDVIAQYSMQNVKSHNDIILLLYHKYMIGETWHRYGVFHSLGN